jgi:hypothetical protein
MGMLIIHGDDSWTDPKCGCLRSPDVEWDTPCPQHAKPDASDSLYAAAQDVPKQPTFVIYAEHYRDGVPDEPQRAVTIHIGTREDAKNWVQEYQANAFEDGLQIRYWFETEDQT